jgi:hypothetical protein
VATGVAGCAGLAAGSGRRFDAVRAARRGLGRCRTRTAIAAAAASRSGGIRWRGERRYIGGHGWMARVFGDGRRAIWKR